ncbi:mannonate dehydratase [Adhaeribacter pallidiroseus]|uniref:mannonate dehydratase n=1 Tax=Adhaeribacter pallidiroseus TaxID=2072847 RepID=A0A369QH33_9BACT|nr:mannonate dehydratase [Adhaeribacter pallidiroseus]RDC61598.1 Mannonate dehydratase [Adhaeribacter pallidiroseus]
MKLSMLLPPKYDERKWTLARQIGVNYAITKAAPELSGRAAPYDLASLQAIKEDFNEAGFNLYGLEGDQFDMSAIKLGLPGRDALIEKYQAMLRNMGRLEIPLLCYNFMAVIGWFRTRVDIPERGAAIVSEFNVVDTAGQVVPAEQQISEEKLWENFFYFLEAVLPVAKEAGVKMALHPDDPPISPLKGVARILTSAAAFDKVWEKFPVESNSITFCQATFKIMGENLKNISRNWLQQNRIAFLHLRDVAGDKYHFRETFHDNGPTPMAELLKHYADNGFTGPLRPDHAPAMYGENQNTFAGGMSVGYEITGKIFAVGCIKGAADACNIPME